MSDARLGDVKVGDVVQPGQFPLIEDAFRITRSATAAPRGEQAWFVLLTDPAMRHSAGIEAYVHRHGFRTYVPKQLRMKRFEVRKNGLASNAKHKPFEIRKISVPILPRYVPVEMPAHDTPFGRLTTPEARAHGLYGFIRRGRFGQPIAIPQQAIAELQEREAAGEFDLTEKRGRKVFNKIDPSFATGKKAAIRSGPFAGYEALIESYLSNGNARAEISIFGRPTPVELTIEQLAAL